MNLIIAQLIGSVIGLLLGCLLVWLCSAYNDRKHARECLRQFNAHVAKLEKQRIDWERMLEVDTRLPGNDR